MSFVGDDQQQKQTIIKLIDEIGFGAIDGGARSESWRQQPGVSSLLQLFLSSSI
ncbi:hypothetical protein [Dyadobacter alkalitolerans]|uniref:hypothetical protein n=1 Tax=Dyadobacter alkalitolerans TaxID=492736 RepID=UPI000401B776|nr:hypothetical protein [Dyadobacter alkalitolerans]